MRRFVLGVAVALAVAAVGVSPAAAQRDSGAKARGDFGRGFWSESSAARNTGYVASAVAPSEEYRSFSYEPATIGAGDTVLVTADQAKVMLGEKTLGTVQNGQEFKVLKVVNGWLGAKIEQNGKTLSGWVYQSAVAPKGSGS